MAKQIFAANILTGGVSGSLDNLKHNELETGNLCIVIDTANDETYFYKYDADDASAESSPDVIIPDSNISGTGCWLLVGITASTLSLSDGDTVWNSGNDGAGSGLDADLLDSFGSAQFLRSDTYDSVDSDILLGIGTASEGSVVLTHSSENNQFYIAPYVSGFQYTKSINFDADVGEWEINGSPTADGSRILTVADEGSGNGIDADTLDGVEGEYYLRSNISDAFSSDIGIDVGSGEGAIRLQHNSSLNVTTITPYDGAAWDYNKQITFDADEGYWNIEGSPRADSNRILTTADEGSGNGIDADTVDSLEASQFLRSDTDTGIVSDKELKIGTGPGSMRIFHNSSDNRCYLVGRNSGDTDWEWTKEITFDADEGEWNIEGTPRAAGYRILTVNDEGTGNGLDADTLDSLESTSFLRSDTSDNVGGQLTFQTYSYWQQNLILNNDVSINAKNVAGSNYAVLQINTSDILELGYSTVPTQLLSTDVSIPNGDLTVGSGDDKVFVNDLGVIEIVRSSGQALIDFKSAASEDFDCRIIQASNGLQFHTGGDGATALAMTINSSQFVTIANGSLTVGGNDDYIYLNQGGGIEISDSAGAGWIDFKTGSAEDYDCRIKQNSDGLDFYTGGDGSTAIGLTISSAQNVSIPSGNLTVSGGSITDDVSAVTASQTNLDVSNIGCVRVDATAGDVTISGLQGGVDGQMLDIFKEVVTNNLIIEHAEGDGTQDIYTADTADITLANYGGIRLRCNGTHWFVISQ